MQMRHFYLRIFGAGALFLIPCVVLAAGLVPDCGVTCTPCDFGRLLQNVIGAAIGITIPLAALLFAYAGFLYFTSGVNQNNISTAKKLFRTVGIGFVIAISAWFIVNTVLFFLIGQNYQGSNFFHLSCNASAPQIVNVQQALCPIFPSACSQNTQGQQNGVRSTAPQGGLPGPSSTVGTNNFLQAVCQVESGCNASQGCTGTNSNAACGSYQVTPATACSTQLNLPGCKGLSFSIDSNNKIQVTENTPGSLVQLQNYLNSSSEQTLANVIVQNNLSQCNGDIACAAAIYNGGDAALQKSACCSTGAAYQCAYDCGTKVSGSYQCDITQSSVCKPATNDTYKYIKSIMTELGKNTTTGNQTSS